MDKRAKVPFTPNISRCHPVHTPLSTGQRAMGWLLLLTPALAALSLSIAAALIPNHRPAWNDYIVWFIPHLFQIICSLVINTIPAFACYWILCRLGDKAEQWGICKNIVWPIVLLLCTLVGCELLWSITGLWLAVCPYTTLALFGVGLFAATLYLRQTRCNPFNSGALHAIYGGLVLINAFWFLHSLADGELFTRRCIFGSASPRSSWENPLLPTKPQSSPPYHSWIFEPHEVIRAVQQHQSRD